MDPTAQVQPQADDMVVKLQKQLDYLKKQKTTEEANSIKQFQAPPLTASDDISAEDILNAFSQGKRPLTSNTVTQQQVASNRQTVVADPQSSVPIDDLSAEDTLSAFSPAQNISQKGPAVSTLRSDFQSDKPDSVKTSTGGQIINDNTDPDPALQSITPNLNQNPQSVSNDNSDDISDEDILNALGPTETTLRDESQSVKPNLINSPMRKQITSDDIPQLRQGSDGQQSQIDQGTALLSQGSMGQISDDIQSAIINNQQLTINNQQLDPYNQSSSDDSQYFDPTQIPTDPSLPITNNLPQGGATLKPTTLPQPTGSMRKEAIAGSSQPETVRYQEIGAELDKDQELEKWVEEVPDPAKITLPKPVQDDYGQILVEASQIPKPKIVLPISEPEMEKALHHKIADSFRWLYEWARRLILLQPGRVYYKKEEK